MQTVTLKTAREHLDELVHQLAQDGEVVITEEDRPVARLIPVNRTSLRNIQPSSVGEPLRPYPATDDDLLDEMRQ